MSKVKNRTVKMRGKGRHRSREAREEKTYTGQDWQSGNLGIQKTTSSGSCAWVT